MTRKRMIHPDYFSSLPLSQMPVPCMVTFAGVWCWADDYGRGEDDPALVKAAVWPRRKAITERHVAEHLDALASAGMLCRYVVGGYRLIHVTNWDEHQRVGHPTPSKLPPCPIHDPDAFGEFTTATDHIRERFRNGSGEFHESLMRGSGNFLPSVVKVSSDQISPSPIVTSVTRETATLGLGGDL